MQRYLAADVPVGEHLADQLLIPMALAGGGEFRTVPLSSHTTTNAALIERFLPVRFALSPGTVRIEPVQRR
jgi:RNA 3'-terminal phosphate cyclase (ATP)